MRTSSVRVRLFIIAAVVVVSIWKVYPPVERIKLGLDLKGGVQLVLRVGTDDALRRSTELAAEQMEHRLMRGGDSSPRGAVAPAVEVVDHASFVVRGIADSGAVRDAARELDATFERRTDGDTHTFRLKPEVEKALRRETVRLTIETIDRRINALGLTEPSVAPYTGDQILLQVPGSEAIQRAKDFVKAGQLRLTLVDSGPFVSLDAAVASFGGGTPSTLEILPGPADRNGATMYYAVARQAAATGAELRAARPAADEFNRPAVAFTLRPDAGRRFGELTARNVGRRLATVLEGRVAAVATIVSRIDDRGQIVGLTREEMKDQVLVFQTGALPAGIDYLDQHTIGASLGHDSIVAGVLASAAGLVMVTLFMLAYYQAMGVNAFVSILLNLLVLLALMAFVDATLTLPGIAGLVLTIGMGVDSNVLIFERLREELAIAAGPRAAVRAAFDRVWITIVDTHVASLLSAAILFQFGTGAVRGFATTLALGLLANVFTSVFVSRTLFDLTLRRRSMDARPHEGCSSTSVTC